MGKHYEMVWEIYKMVETCVEIILRVEDSQLTHICTCDPQTLWGNLHQIQHVHGLAMQLVL